MENVIKTSNLTTTRVIAQAGVGSKSLPVVPVLQQKPKEQEEAPLQMTAIPPTPLTKFVLQTPPKSRLDNTAVTTRYVSQKKEAESMAQEPRIRFNPIQKKANNTGMPDNLKAGIENLSGYDMSDVKVHYNSAKPAQLHAFAYAQGTDIHIGSGQERHLPHEAWHVVQQKQNRVKQTMQMQGGVAVNDDAELEREADVMGSKAFQLKAIDTLLNISHKKETGSVVQCFGRMVEPADEPNLVQHIGDYRRAQGYHQRGFARGEHNVAVGWAGGAIVHTAHSNGGHHSEYNLDQMINPNQNTITRIHTEREPCQDCEQLLTDNYIAPGHLNEDDITYWAEYQNVKERPEEKAALKDIIEDNYTHNFLNGIDGSISSKGRARTGTAQ